MARTWAPLIQAGRAGVAGRVVDIVAGLPVARTVPKESSSGFAFRVGLYWWAVWGL
jgi:hypothetical protein